MSTLRSNYLRLLLVLTAILIAPWLSLSALAQQTTAREIVFPVTIRWNRQRAVSRYRLQIAADERFQNVYLDRRVIGDRYVANQLSPGYYYWRVAAAESQLGVFSRPVRFFISGGVVIPMTLPNRTTRSHPSTAFMRRKVR